MRTELKWLAVAVAVAMGATAAEAGECIRGTVTAKKKKHVQGTIVYLEGTVGKVAAPAEAVRVDQKNMQFEPRVLPILKGTKVEFLNSDTAEHNVYSPDGEKYDLGKWGQGAKREHTFSKAGAYTQLCKFHPAMVAYIVVLENKYFALTKEDGAFEIKDVPPGEYTLAVWNERLKAAPLKVTVEAEKTADVEIALGR